MGKSLMIMGTASSVGKSVVTAGLCRVFFNEGVNVSPFKSQNMALNSFITEEGHEMGRTQVVQAEAAGKKPDVSMNPILLKPSSDCRSQIIVEGKIFRNMNAGEYHKYKPELKEIVQRTYKKLEEKSDLVLLEGAGSPAEINLREGDLVNMGMAEISNSPVILVGDIDRGGVFASIYGTIMLLSPDERARIKGVIINKFRGDVKLLEPGLKMLEDLIHIPVLGVLPWHNIDIEDEDSLTQRFNRSQNSGDINISVLRFPHMSNYTDFTVLEAIDDINLSYISPGESLKESDIIIIPGSKSVITDLKVLRENGWDRDLYLHNRAGKTIIGICGGYQMLGNLIKDPNGIEGSIKEVNGLGLLNIETEFKETKKTCQIKGQIDNIEGRWSDLSGLLVEGYEIHMGVTTSEDDSFIKLDDNRFDGTIKDNIIGTYLNGIVDSGDFRSTIIANIRKEKGKKKKKSQFTDFKSYKEGEFDKLADLFNEHLDMDSIKRIIREW